ncbi:UDP binding domain-containing protein, partial [Vibrio parahaemolyticus]|uniref:UDP binding domain-containing protein n=1 Tax=Vibrio parahaemolyticus TaxID=670 RepID=UPI0027E440C7
IDDLRESPAMEITKEIAAMHSGRVIAVEPNIKKLPLNLQSVELLDFDIAKLESDVHVLLVDHKEFKEACVTTGIKVDTKGIW